MNEVSASDCREYVYKRKENSANDSTLRKEMSFLSRVFARAVEDGQIEKNPWASVKKPSEPKGRPHFLSVGDAGKLLAAAPPDRRFRYLFLIYTGVRKGEALAVTWKDVDLSAWLIRITNSKKGGGQKSFYRVLPVAETLRGDLQARRGSDSERVFPLEHNWTRDLKIDLKAAGLGHCRIHDLRHTYGSWLAQGGVSLHKIRDLMGHASVTTTERYAYLLPGENDAVLNVLADLGSNTEVKNVRKEKK